jgi:hypothetical protein
MISWTMNELSCMLGCHLGVAWVSPGGRLEILLLDFLSLKITKVTIFDCPSDLGMQPQESPPRLETGDEYSAHALTKIASNTSANFCH